MSVSIISSIFLACSLAFSPVATDVPPNSTTHTLTIKVHEGGHLMIDGVSASDTILQLSNANVATLAEEGNTLYTVIQPDGDIFYKGDFTLAIQSVSSGTVKIQIEGGEAILAKAEIELDEA
ncbi:MAG: hypothetical protein AB8F78_14620 [Saprospiraceae bacterium]